MIDLFWNPVILNPILNFLIALSSVLFGSFGLAIIALTIIVRIVLVPLTLKQLRSTKAMQAMQPKMQELQKKYGKNQQKLQQEMAKLYKEAGVNPMGCLWPMLVQFPVWIALYQSIMRALATTPESLLDLSQHLYSWPVVTAAIPLDPHFLWLNLGYPDSTLILAIIVGGTMWVQQKMVTGPSPDPRQQSMNSMMQMMMPLMFALFTLMFPSGLALFWAVSNIIGIGIQYFVTGWGYLRRKPSTQLVAVPTSKSAAKKEKEPQSGQGLKGLLKRRG
jgi:YidC/Oxa1 family membrane protein insertase